MLDELDTFGVARMPFCRRRYLSKKSKLRLGAVFHVFWVEVLIAPNLNSAFSGQIIIFHPKLC